MEPQLSTKGKQIRVKLNGESLGSKEGEE